MTKTRLFQKAYAHELLSLAQGDIETAEALIKASIRRKENVLFHVQQAIEKCLKAMICWSERPVPMVHELSELMREIPNAAQIPHGDQLYDLSQFATIRRYEEGVAVISKEELIAAVQVANEILNWVKKNLH